MSLREWLTLTPEEWQAIAQAYTDNRQALQHEQWERMRILATITIQPHVKSHLTPASLLPFPWDNQPTPNNTQAAREPIPTKEEAHERLVSLMKRVNLLRTEKDS